MARFFSHHAFFRSTQRPFSVFLLAVFCTSFITVIHWSRLTTLSQEGIYYYALAQEGPRQVEKPYAGRFLHPLLARGISDLTGLDLDSSFYLLGMLSLFILFLAVAWILNSLIHVPLLIVPLVLSPAVALFISTFYHHDLFYAALLALLFLSLWREKTWLLSFGILLALFLTRESTLLLSLCIIGVGFFKGKRKIVLPVAGTSLLGLALTSYSVRSSPANVHHMNDIVYLVLKIPFNLLQNVLGIKIWLNTFVKVEPPLFTVNLPQWLHLGSVSAVGLCPWLPIFPLTTLFFFMTSFGITPLIAGCGLSRSRRKIFGQSPPLLLLLAIYGLAGFLITPALGSSLGRYIGYAWPAFWLAVPALAADFYDLPTKAVLRLVVLHVLASWVPFAVYSLNSGSVPIVLSSVACAGVIQALALKEIRRLAPHRGIR